MNHRYKVCIRVRVWYVKRNTMRVRRCNKAMHDSLALHVSQAFAVQSTCVQSVECDEHEQHPSMALDLRVSTTSVAREAAYAVLFYTPLRSWLLR